MATNDLATTQTSAAIALVDLTVRLLSAYWPQLLALWVIGDLVHNVLVETAVRIGFVNSLAGLTTLSLVVLVKLVITVAMFEAVRPGLAVLSGSANATGKDIMTGTSQRSLHQFTTTLTLSL